MNLLPAALEYVDVSFAYEKSQPVLTHVSLTVPAGEFVALIGRNGTGKTTLTRLAMGLIRPNSGTVKVLGRDIAGLATGDIARQIGYVFQNPDRQLFLDTVEKEVAYGPANLGLSPNVVAARVEAALAAVGLQEVRSSYPRALRRSLKQRVALASVLAMQPAILILDEPTSGQDAEEAAHFMSLVMEQHRQGKTVILVTHDMETVARYAQRCLLLGNGGVVFDGPPMALFRQENLLARYGLIAPLAARLSIRLEEAGLPFALTLAELERHLDRLTGVAGESVPVSAVRTVPERRESRVGIC